MKTPQFWLKKNITAYLLLPLSYVYQAFVCLLNLIKTGNQVSKKVICIGNINVGGSGKTPVALMVGKILQELNIDFAYLSRGYLGSEKEAVQIDLTNAHVGVAGDEALLLAEEAPTFIAKNRLNGARIIEKNAAFKAIILDDGMQNKSLKKDFVILVIDGKIQFGNGFLFPAGPLRQSIESGLDQADFVIIIGEIDEKLRKIISSKKYLLAKIKAKNLTQFQGKKLIAFCGIAYPQKFFAFLDNQGLTVIQNKEFPDHYFYQKNDLNYLLKIAKANNAKLITTKKDWVKFDIDFRDQIDFLDIELEPENKALLVDELKKILK